MIKKRPTEIDCICATSDKDIHGEILSIEGADISDLQSGRGIWSDNHGKGFINTLGRITTAKKIFNEEDCEDDRMKYYWNKVKRPYIYAKGVLFDDAEDHENARAASAVLSKLNTTECPLTIKASVEGGTLLRGGIGNKELIKTKISGVALTFSPANTNTWIEPLTLSKSINPQEEEALIKHAMTLMKDNVPSFIEVNNKLNLIKINNNINKLQDLKKALMAGFGYAGKPTNLTGGGVMQSESIDDEIKYITCNHCGKDQVYFPNQVKCRHCNKGFRLKHLVKFNF